MVDNGRISLAQGLGSESFYQLPKVMIGSKYYSKLKSEAKMMFMLLRDRMGASIENARKGDMRFVDDNQDVFIYYPIEELVEDLGWKRDKVMSLKKQLIKYDLIDEVRQGLKKANRIYVKNVETRIELLNMDFEQKKQSENPVKLPEVGKTDFKKSEKSTSRSRKNRLQEVGKIDFKKSGNPTQVRINLVRLNIVRIKIILIVLEKLGLIVHLFKNNLRRNISSQNIILCCR